VQRHGVRIPRSIIAGGLRRRLDDAQMRTALRRLKTERQPATVARVRERHGTAFEDPEIRHAGAGTDGARVHVRRCAVEDDARAPLRVVAGNHAAHGFDRLLHCILLDAEVLGPAVSR
jgi:hypothetical protein